jgi:hypothetical protein
VRAAGRFLTALQASRPIERQQHLPFSADRAVSLFSGEGCCFAQKLTSGTLESAQD